MAILLKFAHRSPSAKDGVRVLVDRREPKGMAEETLKLHAWLPMLGPSEELCRWMLEKPSQWPMIRRRYLDELRNEGANRALNELAEIVAKQATTTLVTTAKDLEHSHAAVLRDLLEGVKKPPAPTGPARAIASGRMRARRSW